MSLSAKEAADQVGLTKQGIIKAIRIGKISAQKDSNGEWQIEPVELFRVYEPVGSSEHQPAEAILREDTPDDNASLQVEVRLLRELLDAKEDVIADLRQRLDAEAEERRKLTMILTNVRHNTPPAAPAPVEPAPQPRSWWQRLIGG